MIPTPRPYKGEILTGTLARQMRYLSLTYANIRTLIKFPHNPSLGALHSGLVLYFYNMLDGTVSLREILMQNTMLPLLMSFDSRKVSEKFVFKFSTPNEVLKLNYQSQYLNLKKRFCYCPKCFEEQLDKYNENFWLLEWAIPHVKICIKHDCPLMQTNIIRNKTTKLYDTTDILLEKNKELSTDKHSILIAKTVHEFLTTDEIKWHSINEWINYYKKLATNLGYKFYQNKNTLRFKIIGLQKRIINFWGKDWIYEHADCFLRDDSTYSTGSWFKNLIILKALNSGISLLDAERDLSF